MKALAINLILAQTIETATADAFSYRPGLVIRQWPMPMMFCQAIVTSWLS